ncbi:MAG: liaS 6 [Jatrophihabitantaceae bacterium]|nr:liaS 6 [Jatrophihabitantaceae bacterium]
MPVREPLSPRQLGWDIALGGVILGAAVAVHLAGTEAVAGNLEPSWLSVLFTALAVGPVVARRIYPLHVLTLTLIGLLLLVATRNTVGIATLGCTLAFYTAVGSGSRRSARLSVGVMVLGVAVGLAMRPVDLSSGGALSTLGAFLGSGVLGLGVRGRQERFHADVVAARERAARGLADERLRITRDLHDIIGHAMGVMVVQAGVAERLLDTNPEEARAAVARIGATGRTSLAEMRQVLQALRNDDGPADALPLAPTPGLGEVPGLIGRVRDAGLPVSYTVSGTPHPLPQGVELAAYRIIQEALTNCLKHAGATSATVVLSYCANELTVGIDDDGRGESADYAATGNGIIGMRERVAAYNGRLTAGPGVRGGFHVEAHLPAPASDRQAGDA